MKACRSSRHSVSTCEGRRASVSSSRHGHKAGYRHTVFKSQAAEETQVEVSRASLPLPRPSWTESLQTAQRHMEDMASLGG